MGTYAVNFTAPVAIPAAAYQAEDASATREAQEDSRIDEAAGPVSQVRRLPPGQHFFVMNDLLMRQLLDDRGAFTGGYPELSEPGKPLPKRFPDIRTAHQAAKEHHADLIQEVVVAQDAVKRTVKYRIHWT